MRSTQTLIKIYNNELYGHKNQLNNSVQKVTLPGCLITLIISKYKARDLENIEGLASIIVFVSAISENQNYLTIHFLIDLTTLATGTLLKS